MSPDVTPPLADASASPLLPRQREQRSSSGRDTRGRSAPQPLTLRGTGRLATRVAGLILAVIAVAAVALRLVAAAPTGRWLDYPFTGVPARPLEAAVIFAHNGRALLGVFGLLLIAQLALRSPG
ncbi:MAG: hypothetical protein ACRDPC_19645, partial [Solirubrobacteraceae bacterium]